MGELSKSGEAGGSAQTEMGHGAGMACERLIFAVSPERGVKNGGRGKMIFSGEKIICHMIAYQHDASKCRHFRISMDIIFNAAYVIPLCRIADLL